jgi:7-cyano-7-deazaguanine synthase in queuosine biosynthesis
MKQIFDTIEQVLLNHQTVGIFVSGGLDSAILSKLVLETKQKLNLNTTLTFYTVPRHDDSRLHAMRVLNYLLQHYTFKIVGNPDLLHSQQVVSGIKQVLLTDETEIILLGDTTNPIELPDGPDRIRSNHKKVIQPFFNFTKKDIVKMAIEHEYFDLFNLTHTCTESKLLRCNTCWQCRERAWAFKENNFIDTGTM